VTPLELEVLKVIRRQGRIGLYGLEDHCNLWRTPKQLRQTLGCLVVDGKARQVFQSDGVLLGYELTPLGINAADRTPT
jgi:hypothetical protein